MKKSHISNSKIVQWYPGRLLLLESVSLYPRSSFYFLMTVFKEHYDDKLFHETKNMPLLNEGITQFMNDVFFCQVVKMYFHCFVS